MKKVISLFLSVLMIFSITAGLDFSMYALSSDGSCGSDATYTYDSSTKTLTIIGTGSISNYTHNGSNCTSPFFSSNVKSIVIGDGITRIGNHAFCCCKNLTNVIIPNSVKSIGDSAFWNCGSLLSFIYKNNKTNWDSINIGILNTSLTNARAFFCPESEQNKCGETLDYLYTYSNGTGVLTISGTGTMNDYDSSDLSPFYNLFINYIIIKNGVTSVGDRAFYQCSNLKSVLLPDGLTRIGDYAFDGSTELTNINLNSGLITIGDFAFSQCPKLTNISIPYGVESIGSYAFIHCTGIRNLVIADSVKIINERAFYNCSGTTNIKIPNSVTSIGEYAFYDCNMLIYSGSASGSPWGAKARYYTVDNDFAYNDVNKTKLAKYLGNDSIIKIPNTVKRIESGAFSGYTELTDLSIPDSVSYIGISAFADCNNLSSVTFGNNLSNIDSYAFSNCSGLACLIIPNSVLTLGEGAFYGCTGLNELSIPCSTKIFNSENSFKGCKSIEKITLTKGNGKMQNYTATNSSTSEYTYFMYTPWYISQDNLKTLNLDEGIEQIGDYAFAYNKALTNITIPISVKSIGSNAFLACTNIKIVNIKDIENWCNIEFVSSASNPLSCSYALYLNNELITDLDIPKSVKTIGSFAFISCRGLNTVSIPDSIVSIGKSAFTGCSNLTEVHTSDIVKWCNIDFANSNSNPLTYAHSLYLNNERITKLDLPKNVKNINSYAFCGCSDITKILIPDSVECLNSNTFVDCSSLISIDIGSGIKSIPADVFKNCINIEQIYLYSTQLDSTQNLVAQMPSGSMLYAYSTTDAQIYCSIYDINFQTIEGLECNLGHHIYELTSETIPTCENLGVQHYNCKYCENSYEVTIPALGHTEVIDNRIEPSCTESGLTEGKHCSVCSSVIVSQEEIPPTGHSYIDTITAPTCKYQGYTTHTCSDCGASYIDSYTNITENHQYSAIVVTPTCAQRGFTLYTCSVCGDCYKTDYTAVINTHDYYSIITTPATCTTKGIKTFTCSICGDKYTEAIDMTSHTPETDKAVAPTCTAAGLTEGSHCSVCGTIITAQTEAAALGHNYITVITAPTCRDKGYTTYTCSRCGDSYRADYTDTTNSHNYLGVVTKQPTCTTNGLKTFTCSVCGDTYNEAVEKIAHTPALAVEENRVEATCTTKGSYDNVVYCTECNSELSRDSLEIDIVPHTVVTDKAVEPTCITTGLTEGSHCSECGEVFIAQNVIDALGHTWNDGEVTKKSTPTAEGIMTYTCTVCGDKRTEAIAKCEKYANPITAKGKTATVKFANLSKKNQTVAQKNAFTVSKAQGKVTYKKTSGNKNITVASNGNITVKKGLKKGTYKINVKVTVAGNATYKAKTVTVTVTIKVK